MKHLLFFLILGIIPYIGISQGSFPFPDSSAIWVNTNYEVVWNDTTPIPSLELRAVKNYCIDERDTLVNAIIYSQIFICDSIYKGAIRDTSNKVYFVPKDSIQEFLLYDFTAEAGDTLDNIYMEEWNSNDGGFLFDLVVQSVYNELINDEYRKVIVFMYSKWIEGIGCEQGLFLHPFTNVSNASLQLHCMSKNNEILFPEYSEGSCSLTVNINEERCDKSIFSIFPNPTEKDLFISFNDNTKIEEINIYNHLGQKVKQEPNSINYIDVSTLKTGFYIIEVVTQKSSFTERLIKK